MTSLLKFTVLMSLLPFKPIGKTISILWVYGGDRKIRHEGHCSGSRGLPSDGIFYPHFTSMMNTFSCIPFDLKSRV